MESHDAEFSEAGRTPIPVSEGKHSRDIRRLEQGLNGQATAIRALRDKLGVLEKVTDSLTKHLTFSREPFEETKRKTPLRKWVDLNSYELRLIIHLMRSAPANLEDFSSIDEALMPGLFNRLKEIESAWEKEANENGEFF